MPRTSGSRPSTKRWPRRCRDVDEQDAALFLPGHLRGAGGHRADSIYELFSASLIDGMQKYVVSTTLDFVDHWVDRTFDPRLGR